jgi:hypothetical protein
MNKQIKNIGGSIGYDIEGNTYTRDVEVDKNNQRFWGEWELNNQLGCSGRSLEYYNKENKKYEEIQKMCSY